MYLDPKATAGRSRPPALLIIVFLLGAFSLFAVGCGSGDSDSGSQYGQDQTEPTEPTTSPADVTETG